jgi:hypothetical protein
LMSHSPNRWSVTDIKTRKSFRANSKFHYKIENSIGILGFDGKGESGFHVHAMIRLLDRYNMHLVVNSEWQ